MMVIVVDRPALTDKQLRVMRFIQSFIASKGFPPVCDDLSQEFGINRMSAWQHLRALERKGYIQREKYRAGGIRVLVSVPSAPAGSTDG